MASLGREAFADEGSWLQYQANLVRLLRPHVERPLTAKDRETAKRHRKKYVRAVWYIRNKEQIREYWRNYQRQRRQSDEAYRRQCNQQRRAAHQREAIENPDAFRLRLLVWAEYNRTKLLTDPDYHARKKANDHNWWMSLTPSQREAKRARRRELSAARSPEQRERDNARKRARRENKKAAKLAAQSQPTDAA